MSPTIAVLSVAFLSLISFSATMDYDDSLSGSGADPPPDGDDSSNGDGYVYETYPYMVYGNLSCELYTSGGECERVLPPTLPVLSNLTRGPQSLVKGHLDYLFQVLSQSGSSQQCTQRAIPILCLFTFPYCDPAYEEPIYQPICQRDCELMRDLICPAEWTQMQHLEGIINLRTIDTFNCSKLAPANAGEPPMCISIFDGGRIPPSQLSGHTCYSGSGRGYTGTINRTISGYECQVWTHPSPHRHLLSPLQYPELMGDHNYCRNPGNKGDSPWCFTTNTTKRWEYCDVPKCSIGPKCELYRGDICRTYGRIGLDYVFINETSQNDLERQINAVIGSLENFPECRESMIQLLCHVNFQTCDLSSPVPTPRKVCTSYCQEVKEHCQEFYEYYSNFMTVINVESLVIPSECTLSDTDPMEGGESPECYTPPIRTQDLYNSDCYNASNKGMEYNGTVNITVSGHSCQHWDSSVPHYHPLTSLFRRYLEGHNYCRNPDGRGLLPWCYTTNVSVRWEYCDIAVCMNEDSNIFAEHMWPIIGGGVAIAVIVLIIMVIIIMACITMNRQSRSVSLVNKNSSQTIEVKILNEYTDYSTNPTPEEDVSEFIEDTSLPLMKKEQLVYLCDLGEGHFGKVLKAEAVINDEKMVVAVKVLKEGTSYSAKKEFFREACLMNEYSHKNIVKLLGVCAKDQPLCMVFEYMEMGDLHSFLRQNAPNNTFSFPIKGPKTLADGVSLSQLVSMCVDISAGLNYLSSHHYIHRDLATRNCLVDGQLCIKISDFGMSQDIYVSDYFRLGDSEMLPIRWMPPEAIMYSTFSIQSDVWSFGVVLWEIFSFGMQPYYGMSNEQVVQYVKESKVMDKPERCPQEIYDLMLDCWVVDPKERPKANEIYQGLLRWTPELSAQINKNEEKVSEVSPDYQNMSVILQWAAATNGDAPNNHQHNYTLLEEPEEDQQINFAATNPDYDKLAPI